MTDAAVVTGAAGALGRAIAERLADDVDALLLIDLPSESLQATEQSLSQSTSARVTSIGCDITATNTPSSIVKELASLALSPRILVNNAGINRDSRATKMTDEHFRAVVNVDLVAPARLAMELHPLMPNGSSVINIASRAALGSFGQANYAAAKSGLVALTRALALLWAPTVRVNAVAPGLIDTPMTASMPKDVLAAMIERVPAGRMGEAAEVADLVAFCSSPAASYLTGQLLLICGGRSIAP